MEAGAVVVAGVVAGVVVAGVVFGTQEPWSFLDSVSAQTGVVVVTGVVVTGVVDAGVVVTGVVDAGVVDAGVVEGVVAGVVGTHDPLSFVVSVEAQDVAAVVLLVAVVTGVVEVLELELELEVPGWQSKMMLWNPKLQSPLTLTCCAPPH